MNDNIVFIDFETESDLDLKKVGAYCYAAHPSTQATYLAAIIDGQEIIIDFKSNTFGEQLSRITTAISDGCMVAAWNIEFDRLVWNMCVDRFTGHNAAIHTRVITSDIRISQCIDIMAMAQAMGLPAKLRDCAQVFNMKKLKMPNRKASSTVWEEYCLNDVRLARDLYQILNPLTVQELGYMHNDMQINDFGVPIDLDAVYAAIRRETELVKILTEESVQLCGFKPTQTKQIAQWAGLADLTKATVTKALARKNLRSDVRRVLEIRQMVGKSSVAKIRKMAVSQVSARIRGVHRYHAATTGRAGGRLVQLQNPPRPKLKEEEIEHHINTEFRTASMQDLSDCIRALICPAYSGGTLVCADYSNIEGRIAAWVSGEAWKLKAFRDFDSGTGHDLYKLAAARIYNVKVENVSPEQRQVGKTAELACGFQGGINAFLSMADIFGLHMTDEQAQEIVTAWRKAHPNIVKMWAVMDSDAKKAVQLSGTVFGLFVKSGEHLYMQLPSGRKLCYPFAKLEPVTDKFGRRKRSVTFYGQDTYTRQWGRIQTYGGKLFENLVQALARDILYHAIHGLLHTGHEVIMHVHDEIVVEACTTLGKGLSVETLCKIMCDLPGWAEGLPLTAEGWEGRRYKKT